MNDIAAVIVGLAAGTSVFTLLAFIAAYSTAKKESKKGPMVISIEGKLNLSAKEVLTLLLITWLVSMVVFVVTAFGLAQSGEKGIMPASIFIAAVSAYFYAKKNILKTARKKIR